MRERETSIHIERNIRAGIFLPSVVIFLFSFLTRPNVEKEESLVKDFFAIGKITSIPV